jgi:hypothetical protein
MIVGRTIIQSDKLVIPEGTNPPHYRDLFPSSGHLNGIFDFDSFVEHFEILGLLVNNRQR